MEGLSASLYHGYMLTLSISAEWVRGTSKGGKEERKGGKEERKGGRKKREVGKEGGRKRGRRAIDLLMLILSLLTEWNKGICKRGREIWAGLGRRGTDKGGRDRLGREKQGEIVRKRET